MARSTLILFARAPAIGRGKTRLARDTGAVQAWRLSRAFLHRISWRLRAGPWIRVTALTPDLAGRVVDLAPGWRRVSQGGGDLGSRLERAVKRAARGPVAVVGSDAPDVTAADVRSAFRAIKPGRPALGPADDGGFWLLALAGGDARRLNLKGVRWSTPDAAADVACRYGRGVSWLRRRIDIDDGPSLRAWRGRGSGWRA